MPAIVLFLISLAAVILDFEMERRSYVYSPYYETVDFDKVAMGSYTLDNFSCQISRWLAGDQKARTAKACAMGKAMRWTAVTLFVISYVVVVATLISMRAEKKAKRREHDRKLSLLSESDTVVPSGHAMLAESEKGEAELESPVSGGRTEWSPISPPGDVRTNTTGRMIEKQGREVFEKDGWHRVELPTANSRTNVSSSA